MTARTALRRVLVIGSCVMLMSTGCAFHGLNSLPLPGAVGRGPDADTYHVELANVITMESNSPVMIDDVVVGSVGPMTVKDWHADVQISVKHDLVIPANVEASIGQTSLLGSMHLELNPPLGRPGVGRGGEADEGHRRGGGEDEGRTTRLHGELLGRPGRRANLRILAALGHGLHDPTGSSRARTARAQCLTLRCTEPVA